MRGVRGRHRIPFSFSLSLSLSLPFSLSLLLLRHRLGRCRRRDTSRERLRWEAHIRGRFGVLRVDMELVLRGEVREERAFADGALEGVGETGEGGSQLKGRGQGGEESCVKEV